MRGAIRRDAIVTIGLLILTTSLVLAGSRPAWAGHEYALNGHGGDCWRPLTPVNCRASWYSGDGHSIYLRIINQLSDAGLWNAATTACNNWQGSVGPQYCYSTAHTNDSWDYFKRDDSLPAPNG